MCGRLLRLWYASYGYRDCGLEAEPYVWKAAASVVCLVRV